MSAPRLVLASGSPRRRELLRQLGLKLIVEVPDVDETPLPGEEPETHTMRLAATKAAKIAARYPDDWVLGADTTVVVDGAMLGKPVDADDAFRMLSTISGRWHIVVTGFCLLKHNDNERFTGAGASEVYIRQLTPEQIRAYVATGEPMDKAGAYAIQDIGASLVQVVRGSYTNVVGLPLAEVAVLWEKIHGQNVLIERDS